MNEHCVVIVIVAVFMPHFWLRVHQVEYVHGVICFCVSCLVRFWQSPLPPELVFTPMHRTSHEIPVERLDE